jgi:flagellar biosynthesis/type III secretory pathway chaperone
MQAQFADLAALLCQEIEHYRRLLALVRRERGKIVRGELAGLTELVRKKERLTQELVELEASRTSVVDKLAERFGERGGDLTLARVAQLAPPESRESLDALLAEFRGTISRLVAANDVNRTLLGRSLEFVQASLALFRTVVNANPTYDASGRVETADGTCLALNRMA